MSLAGIVDLRRRSLRRRTLDLITLADQARDSSQWELATRLYRKVLYQNPRNAGIWVQYGHALKESGQLRDPDKLAQAEIAYRWALSLDPRGADAHLQLGHALKLQGKTEEAAGAYLRAFALEPSVPHPLQELSELGWSEAQVAGLKGLAGSNSPPPAALPSQPASKDDVRAGPNGASGGASSPSRGLKWRRHATITLADRARDERNWQVAARLYRRALDRNPRNAEIWVQYGHALKESGDLRDPDKLVQAEAAYRAALSLEPSAADTYLQLGHALKLQGKTEVAQAAYLRAFASNPSLRNSLDELSALGWSAEGIGELSKLCSMTGGHAPAVADLPAWS